MWDLVEMEGGEIHRKRGQKQKENENMETLCSLKQLIQI